MSQKLTRGLSLSAAAALVVGIGGLIGTPTASAGTQVYGLSSEAVAVQTTMTDPGLPFGVPFSVGSYGASTVLNSNGESSADAGAPYSPLVSSLPNSGNGLVQSATGQGLPVVPTFPGYVSAKDPVLPLNEQNAGGYELIASALPTAASGKVSLGGQAATSKENNAFAVANSLAQDARIFTEGAAGVHALTLNGILDLANVSSYASLTQESGGDVVPVTVTNLGTITFAGLASGLSADGVRLFGSGPVPVTVEGLPALNDALKPTGVTLAYLPQEYRYSDGSTSTGPTADAAKTIAGVTTGALRMFLTNTSDRGTTTETVTIGRIAVSAAGRTIDGGSPGAVDTTTTDAGAVAGNSVVAGADFAAAPGLGNAPTSTVPVGTLPTQNFAPASSSGSVAGSLHKDGAVSYESFYLFVVLAGAAALIGTQVIRVVAVRRSA